MHFVKHSLILAMLAVLTGCGGGSSNAPAPSGGSPTTPEDTVKVSSVTPLTATVGVLSTFTLTGQKITEDLRVNLTNCDNISSLSGTTTQVRFTCTPRTTGVQTLTVKTAAGVTLLTGEITVQATPPADSIVISNVSVPTEVVTGDLASFTITGQNLTNTMQITLTQCLNLTQNDVTPTKITFTCLPQLAGTQILEIKSAGKLLDTRQITVQPPKPKLTGSWRQTAAEGCTGTVGGEAIVGVRSNKPLFTFVGDIKTQVRLLGNEGISYTTVNCSEVDPVPTTPPRTVFALTTGIATPVAIYGNIGAVQRTGDTFYYPVTTTYSNNSTATPPATAIVFKNPDTFCLFDGVVSAANISQYIQNVDLTRLGCFTRSTTLPFSQEKPSAGAFFSEAVSALVERSANESILNLLNPIAQRGQTGYVLLGDTLSLRPEASTGSPKAYNLFTQITEVPDFTFAYRIKDEPVQDANFAANRLRDLNQLGSEGFLFLGRTQLSPVSQPKTLYSKTTNPTAVTSKTFTYQTRNDSDVNATKLISALDALGATGCRFVDIRLQTTPANTHTTVCVNSSQHTGAFAYRYVPYPTSTRTEALTALLNAQKSNGFYPIRVMTIGTDAVPHILFEYDSAIESNIGSMQYKVYSQTLPNNLPELSNLLNDQGSLGWHLWSPINTVSNTPLATIFASIPFPHLPDGEPVSLDPR